MFHISQWISHQVNCNSSHQDFIKRWKKDLLTKWWKNSHFLQMNFFHFLPQSCFLSLLNLSFLSVFHEETCSEREREREDLLKRDEKWKEKKVIENKLLSSFLPDISLKGDFFFSLFDAFYLFLSFFDTFSLSNISFYL